MSTVKILGEESWLCPWPAAESAEVPFPSSPERITTVASVDGGGTASVASWPEGDLNSAYEQPLADQRSQSFVKE